MGKKNLVRQKRIQLVASKRIHIIRKNAVCCMFIISMIEKLKMFSIHSLICISKRNVKLLFSEQIGFKRLNTTITRNGSCSIPERISNYQKHTTNF